MRLVCCTAMVRRISQHTSALIIFLVLPALVWPAENPFVGTWKLNADKSRASSGQMPTGRTTKIDSEGKDLVLTLEGGGITMATKQRRSRARHRINTLSETYRRYSCPP